MPAPTIRARAVALSAALALAAACGGGGGDDDAGDVIPFVSDPVADPASQGVAAPADVPDCTSGQLVVGVLPPDEAVTSGAELVGPGVGDVRTLGIQAREEEVCGLTAMPTVHLDPVEATAGPLEVDPTEPLPDRLLMAGRQRLISPLVWPSSCAAADAAIQAVVDVAGGTLTVELPDPPECDPEQPSHLGEWVPALAPAEPLPLDARFVDPPSELPYGGTVKVVVELRNDGVGPFQFAPCPSYRITFGESDAAASATHRFNCAAAPAELAPGESLRFAAELDLPADEIDHDLEGALDVWLTDDIGATAHTDAVSISTD